MSGAAAIRAGQILTPGGHNPTPNQASIDKAFDRFDGLHVSRDVEAQRDLPVVDLSIEDPPLEAVIDQIYQEGSL